MGTSEKVNEASCYVTLIYNKLADLDKDLKRCYNSLRVPGCDHEVIKTHIKYFSNEKSFWFGELKKYLGELNY